MRRSAGLRYACCLIFLAIILGSLTVKADGPPPAISYPPAPGVRLPVTPILEARTGSQSVLFEWNLRGASAQTPPAEGFEIRQYGGKSYSIVVATILDPRVMSYEIGGLKAGSPCYFTIRSFYTNKNQKIYSDFAEPVMVTP